MQIEQRIVSWSRYMRVLSTIGFSNNASKIIEITALTARSRTVLAVSPAARPSVLTSHLCRNIRHSSGLRRNVEVRVLGTSSGRVGRVPQHIPVVTRRAVTACSDVSALSAPLRLSAPA
jgi:hypothetical protein